MIMTEFGRMVRERMAELKLSQSALSAKTGVLAGTVSQWCAGLRKPERTEFDRLLVALKLPPFPYDELRDWTD